MSAIRRPWGLGPCWPPWVPPPPQQERGLASACPALGLSRLGLVASLWQWLVALGMGGGLEG